MDTSRPNLVTSPIATESPAAEPRLRGFAALDPEARRVVARRGGEAAHRAGTAHEFTAEEARVAGKKGGHVTQSKRRAKR
jgi:general stress protein YciG